MEVMITGRSTPLTPREAVQGADIIIFSVSIRAVASAIDELIPSLPPDRLVMDFTGIKQEASRHLRQYRN
jgi:prephenate dehydrogenase